MPPPLQSQPEGCSSEIADMPLSDQVDYLIEEAPPLEPGANWPPINEPTLLRQPLRAGSARRSTTAALRVRCWIAFGKQRLAGPNCSNNNLDLFSKALEQLSSTRNPSTSLALRSRPAHSSPRLNPPASKPTSWLSKACRGVGANVPTRQHSGCRREEGASSVYWPMKSIQLSCAPNFRSLSPAGSVLFWLLDLKT